MRVQSEARLGTKQSIVRIHRRKKHIKTKLRGERRNLEAAKRSLWARIVCSATQQKEGKTRGIGLEWRFSRNLRGYGGGVSGEGLLFYYADFNTHGSGGCFSKKNKG